jgi:transposase
MLGCENTVIEGVDWHEDDTGQLAVTVHVRPRGRLAGRCPACGKKRPGYDQGQGRRRWRALDLGTVRAELEAAAPRVACPEHGIVVAAVPWARHGAAHTRFFDDQVAWLAVACSKTAITSLMRISWRTVGHVIARVPAGQLAAADPMTRHWPPVYESWIPALSFLPTSKLLRCMSSMSPRPGPCTGSVRAPSSAGGCRA